MVYEKFRPSFDCANIQYAAQITTLWNKYTVVPLYKHLLYSHSSHVVTFLLEPTGFMISNIRYIETFVNNVY